MDKTDIVRSIDKALGNRDFERLFQIRKEYEKAEKNDADLAYFFLIYDMEKDITGNVSDGIISTAGNFENAVRIIKKTKEFHDKKRVGRGVFRGRCRRLCIVCRSKLQ
ncbi:hypothetical protein [Butyrivibrio sp. AE3003]|uniref:hypothetical protein n=1 Tax=Butyrivibrio sp. AE3003 TaxID=1496721 RepID=UPI00047E211B|nr:hypothetical protein [Butyrivibrio sp. AE3003]